MKKLFVVFFLLLAAYRAYPIAGPPLLAAGEIGTYNYYGSVVYLNYQWGISGGSMLQSYRTGTTYTLVVQWNTTGTKNLAFLDNNFVAQSTLSVTVSGVCTPANPTATLTVSSGCGSKSISYPQTPPGGAVWYWQTTPSGISTASSANPYTVTTSGIYYLRARSSTKDCWSSGTVLVDVTVTPPSPPSNPSATLTPASSTCTPRTISYSQSPPGGVVWYWQTDAAGTSTTNSTNTYSATSSGTYYLRAYDPASTCWSSGATSAAVTVTSLPSTPSATIDITTNTCGPRTLSTTTTPPGGVVWYWQTDPAGTTLSPTYITYTAFTSGTVYVRAQDSNGCWSTSSQSYGPFNINDPPAPSNPTTTNNSCGGQTLSKNGSPPANVSWYWQGTNSAGTDYTSPTATAATYPVSATGTYYLRARNSLGCWSQSSAFVSSNVNLPPTAPAAPTVSTNTCYDKTLTKGTPPANVGWFWQGTNSAGTDYTSATATAATYVAASTNTYYIRSRNSLTGCWGNSTSVAVTVDKPSAPANNTMTYCEWDVMALTTTSILSNLKWYNTGGTLLYTGTTYTPVNLGTGTYTYNVKNVSAAGCESQTSATFTLTVPSNCDPYLNWAENTVFTVNSGGTTVSAAASKSYIDGLGGALQSQSRNQTANQVLAVQSVNDSNGQPALVTLPAPINSTSFVYRHKFVTNASGTRYHANDFDKRPESTNPGGVNFPAAVGNGGIGTLGWYYSSSNTTETLTPTTGYPYARSYTPDGPDPVTSKSAGPGDQHKMGSTHEVVSDRAKITTELAHYYSIRVHFVAAPNNTIVPANPGYKYINTDPNGKKVVSFVDSDGRTLASATLTGTSTYDNWSYTFYNDLNQLVAQVAPNGVNVGTTAYPGFVTLYKYDHLGRLIETTSPDEGTSRFVYSFDGKIRFSQNQLQSDATPKRFSYTNYDQLGRLIEAGEYTQSGTGFYVFEPHTVVTPVTNSVLGIVDLVGYSGATRKSDPSNRCTDYTYVEYDLQASDLPAGDALHATQANMFGQVSRTENVNANTWYSYDEFGQLLWTKQYINDLAAYKTVDYTYDFAGNVTEVAYQKGVATEDFHHYYFYDADQRLIELQTSVDAGTTKVSRAKYFYYLHGPLKRVTLMNGATKVQGIDYVYTINGALKGINHVDNARDPGNDSDDVFGETLSYYDNDYTGAAYMAGTQAFAAYTNQFGGAVKGISWRSPADNQLSKNAYAFTYDPLYQFTNGDFGTLSGTSAYTFGAATNVHKETIGSYDKNGNINSLQRRGKLANLTGDYSYVYTAGTNKLDKVNHAGALMTDYAYNSIGQMTQQVDGSKTMNVTYNAYGLVKNVKNGSGQLLQEYFYDDRGNRFISKIYNIGTLVKTVFYIYDAGGNVLSIYEKINTTTTLIEVPLYASGRVAVFKPPVNTYFYEVSDHLGNVRAVIGLPETDIYRATMESENSILEEPTTGFFKNITPRRVNFVGANVTTNYTNSLGTAVTGNEVVRLNNTAPAGPGISLKVSPGDKISSEVWAYYEAGSSYGTMQAVSTMVTAIAGAFGGVNGAPGESGRIYNAINSGVTGYIGSGTESTLPAAYLQYIVYDANLNPTGQKGFFRVTTSSNTAKAKIPMPEITIEQPGFIYIFTYNRSNAANWVFFDEMLVTHVHSTIVAGADYYPFGLAMDGREITDEAYRYGYQGQYSEKNDSTRWNAFELRMYDPRIGRWLSPDPYGQFASPYVAMGNIPHMGTDPDGGWCCAGVGMMLPEVVVTASRISVSTVTSVATSVGTTILQDGFKSWTSTGLMIEPNVDPYQASQAQLTRWNSPTADTSFPQPDLSPLTSISVPQPSFSLPSAQTMQTVASFAGWIPGVQTVAGLAEAGIAIYRGDYGGATLAALGAIPVAGYLVKSARAARSLYKISGVYDITVTGARYNGRYVGEAKDIVRRLRQHTGLFGKFRGHKIQVNEVYSMPGSSSRYREVLEQQILNSWGGKNAPGVLNKIDPHRPSAGLILF